MGRVLIIEDDRFNRRLYKDLLEAEGLDVLLACSADEGLTLARETLPDLVVMDIEMPGMSGLEATRQLKADERTRAVPVLVISAHAMIEHEANAHDAGCAGFLRKPLEFPGFQEVVMRLVAEGKRPAAVSG